MLLTPERVEGRRASENQGLARRWTNMSQLIVAPEMMTSAASDLATIGSNVSAAHMVAAAPTTAISPAAADEVSASIAHLFSQHAASYQAQAAQVAAFNDQFVQRLSASAAAYASAEAANTALLQPLTATAELSGSGSIGVFWDQLVNWAKLTVWQGNSLTTILTLPYTILFVAGAIAFAFVFFGLLVLLSLPNILFR